MGTKNLYVNKKLASVEQNIITKGQKVMLHHGNKPTRVYQLVGTPSAKSFSKRKFLHTGDSRVDIERNFPLQTTCK
jgi:hypothetical protein